ncbi:hypothetical protein IOD16_38020 [Saccharothrix sp. 6-C]|uniref:Uncharacterized protein n=1 Tax=Saccharothrix texasensis TaxID=103734 RepID=A0A3N1H942_9PSEU|nr:MULTISPECIES: hypothetical protein [Saccharothrix]QQQ76706.1 hypothetical protein IOD16_38020 [Saccharothrix sp. 6-C]ROP39040.1 hypothetical protein EDD40_4409 [Saccharothrix texasensis]
MEDAEVVAEAPKLFAIVQEAAEDGWVAAWGLDFGNGTAEVTGPDGGPGLRISTTSAERALWYFAIDRTARARLVWVEREEVVREPQSVT